MIYVVDSSVALKWFAQEEGTDQALTFKEDFLEGKVTLTSPDLMLYEVAHVLRHKKQFTETAVNETLHYLLDIGVEIFTPTEELMEKAVHFTFQTGLSFYDCLYLALANQLGSHLVTADETLHKKGRNFLPITLIQK